MSKKIYTVNGTFPGNKLRGKDRYKRLYHYTSFDTFVKIWLTKQLRFGAINSMNDIQEAVFTSTSSNMQQLPLLHAYNDVRTSFKQISLTMDYDTYLMGCMSPMMWGHYADKRKGVCIELDYDKIEFPKDCIKGIVRYKKVLKKSAEIPPTIKSVNDLIKYIIKNKNDLFFTKQTSWKGENEYRVISSNSAFLNIADAITAVYLTTNDSLECLLVEKLINDQVPVQYLHYINSDNMAIPVISNTKKYREQYDANRTNPNNVLLKLHEQALSHYENLKDDLNADLTKSEYSF